MDWEKYIKDFVTYTEHTKSVSVLEIDEGGEINKVDVLDEKVEDIGKKYFTCLLCNKRIKDSTESSLFQIFTAKKIKLHFEKNHLQT